MCFLHMLPFHNVIFFHNHCTIDSTTMSIAYPQHIHTVLLQLHYPVHSLCCLYMLSFSQCDIFLNQCIIHFITVFTAYPQHMHTVLFTITLPSRLTLLFTYVILFTMWYFFTITTQLTLHQCLQHILNIYIQYCLKYTTLYNDFAVYICFLFTIWYFFTITAQLTLQQCLQHIRNIYI